MNADYKKILQSLKTRQYAPFYLVDGDENYYIDTLTEQFENILPPHERDFNLMVLYGKESSWADVVNACRRFPMFAEKQVVILKDAASLKDFGELLGYLEKPSPTTILLIEHRYKKADGKTKIVKYIKDKGWYFNSEKVKDSAMPQWIQDYGLEIGFQVAEREAQILATYLGNDLQKIANEIEKVRINVPEEKALTSAMIQKYIGISREYNIFEFAEVVTCNDKDKLYRMLSYFISSPKAAPMPLLIGAFYGHFSKLYAANFVKGKPEKDAAAALGTWPSKLKEIMATTQQWPQARTERAMLLLGKYSTMGVGVKSNSDDKELLKELIGQLLVA